MRFRTTAVVAALATSLFAAACGSAAPAPAQTDPKDLKADLTWWDTSDPKNEAPAFQELIAQFNKTYPNVKINYQSVPFGDAQNKFKTAAAAKSGAPDILRAEVAGVPEFPSLGYLYALDGSDLLSDESDYFSTPLGSDKYN